MPPSDTETHRGPTKFRCKLREVHGHLGGLGKESIDRSSCFSDQHDHALDSGPPWSLKQEHLRAIPPRLPP